MELVPVKHFQWKSKQKSYQTDKRKDNVSIQKMIWQDFWETAGEIVETDETVKTAKFVEHWKG